MPEQSSEFTGLVQEALRDLPEGGAAELVDQAFDEENFGNAVATLDLRGLRFRFARDRGFVTVDVGRTGRDAESFPLEDLAAKLGWLPREELEAHYESLEFPGEPDGSRPPLQCHTWDLVQGVLQEESAWEALREACTAAPAETPQLARADIGTQTESGCTDLHQAAMWLDGAAVRALIDEGLDPNAETSSGRTPLLYAESKEAFDALLKGGANLGPIEAVFAPNGQDAVRFGDITSLVLARAVRQVGRFASAPLVKQLIDINPSFAEVPDSISGSSKRFALHFAAQYNEDPAMITALSTDKVCATTVSYRQPLLAVAAWHNGNPAVVKALLDAGAHVNCRQCGGTPLYYAVLNASPLAADTVRLLLDAGADANGRDENGKDTGYVPLNAAVATRNLAAMKLLLDAGAEGDVMGSSEFQSLVADMRGR